MNLQQQIIESEVSKLEDKLSTTRDDAFLRFSHSLTTGYGIKDFDSNDNVDGGQDKQIDSITIDEHEGIANIYIIQAKMTESFSSNMLINMRNGLNWIFNKSRDELETLSNQNFKDKIIEYRSVQSNLGPSNINIEVFFVTNGDEKEISDEYKQEEKTIIEEYDSDIFNNFSFSAIGCNELVNLIKRSEKNKNKIDADIKMKYDANNPSIIKYHSGELQGLVASIPAKEIARIVNNDKYGYVFDSNIRRFLGKKGQVNKEIRETAIGDNSHMFWYLNNGITIVCDHFDAVTDPDNPIIKIKNLQIVNGCQTATTLANVEKEGLLRDNTKVQTKIYQSKDVNLVSEIVLTTNNQNKINNRNLRSNDSIQIDLLKRFKQMGYSYERTDKEFNYTEKELSNIVSNELVGQAYLAIVLKKPSDARGRKYKIWSDHYSKIFRSHIVEPYIYCYEIYRIIESFLKGSGLAKDSNEVIRKIAKNGTFHICRIFSFLHRSGDNWNKSDSDINKEIKDLSNDYSSKITKSVNILKNIINNNARFKDDIDAALKAYDLDKMIDKELHTNHRI